MYDIQIPWADLFHALEEYKGTDAYSDVLEPWREQNAEEVRWLADFSRRTEGAWKAATDQDLCQLYAIFRVTSLLLLRFQVGSADGTNWPGPPITLEGYRRFYEALGFRVPEPAQFHPFFHEILTVQQAPTAETPITLLEERWPPLMLGTMMFCRAGVGVNGGTAHVVKDIAERSTLYWTYRRKDRPCNDLSQGWGSNSQWRTRLRRDYRTSSGFHYNVDAKESLNSASTTMDAYQVPFMVELVRNRCMIRSPAEDSDLYPYKYSYVETAAPATAA